MCNLLLFLKCLFCIHLYDRIVVKHYNGYAAKNYDNFFVIIISYSCNITRYTCANKTAYNYDHLPIITRSFLELFSG